MLIVNLLSNYLPDPQVRIKYKDTTDTIKLVV
jgi:hypothetical protein